jgi:hypothetical protein
MAIERRTAACRPIAMPLRRNSGKTAPIKKFGESRERDATEQPALLKCPFDAESPHTQLEPSRGLCVPALMDKVPTIAKHSP